MIIESKRNLIYQQFTFLLQKQMTYKEEMEAWVTGHTGGSMLEVVLIAAVPLVRRIIARCKH